MCAAHMKCTGQGSMKTDDDIILFMKVKVKTFAKLCIIIKISQQVNLFRHTGCSTRIWSQK